MLIVNSDRGLKMFLVAVKQNFVILAQLLIIIDKVATLIRSKNKVGQFECKELKSAIETKVTQKVVNGLTVKAAWMALVGAQVGEDVLLITTNFL